MNNMPPMVVADGHVHIYPAYEIRALFRHLIQNLDRLAGRSAGAAAIEGSGKIENEIHKLAFLAEGRDYDYFNRLQNQDKTVAADGFDVANTPDPVCLTVSLRGAGRVCLVAGRQIVTRERLEILGLAMCAKIPDGLPARDAIRRVVEAGGIPVLAWSPGKWLFARGRLVRELMSGDHGRVLRMGDTTLRPALWPEPRPMRLARARGLAVIPGSDPLPLAGEERYAGTYGFVCRGAFDASQPAAAIGRMLAGPAAAIMPAGARCGTWAVARRLYRLQTKD